MNKKKILLVEPKTTAIAYNIALMKLARWCENKGYEYKYVRGIVKDIDFKPDQILMSCIFTFYADRYEKTIDFYLKKFPKASFLVGGVFPTITPQWFNRDKWIKRVKIFQGMCKDFDELIPKYNVDIIEANKTKKDKQSKKSIVLYSSRGCVNKCKYCAVPKLEGKMRPFKSIIKTLKTGLKESPDAKSVVLYDNNFTAHKYWDRICDELIDFGLPVDIHGLHVSSFTKKMAKKFAKMKWGAQGKENSTPYLRFSFDKMIYEKHVRRALGYVTDAGIKAEFFCYLLFNFDDSPHDFWARLVKGQDMVNEIGKAIYFFPQRFEPFSALKKYQYVSEDYGWTQELATGARRMTTYIHGFLTVTKSGNLFNWVGHNYEEFLEHLHGFGSDRTYGGKFKELHLERKGLPVPSLTY